jgi:hypothetical protein
MQPSKDIEVVLNDYDRFTIGKDQRSVKADDIYNLLAYSRGDTYTVESVNEKNVDVPVLQFFTELFGDITNRLNRISGDQEGEDDEEEGEFSTS